MRDLADRVLGAVSLGRGQQWMLRSDSGPSFKIGELLGGVGRAGDRDPLIWSRSGVARLSR
jgi:hypothetical protein